jgi:hypothetical protein
MLLLNYTLHKIAAVTNGGEKLVVGVSEMNDLNNYGYYEVYSLIKQILPNAKLFYYTDLGQSVSSVESVFQYLQSNGITLNYIGYDVYPYPSYNYANGVVSIPSNYVNQILDLENFANQQGVSFFIGEIGFRDGDVQGYNNPASTTYIDFNSPAGYQDTINYYEDVISQLNSMGINFIGIWNYNGWNGDPFGLWNNPYFNQLLEFVGIHPVEIARIDVVSTFSYYYINGTIYNVNKTYVVILPANITLINEKYINSTSRLILTNVTINGNSTSGSFVLNQQGEYTIMANYVIQYYVTTNVNVSAYVNGIKEELSSGWYNRGSTIQVFPQIIPISQHEIYNITRTFHFIVDYPMSIKIPYIVEYYVNVNFTGPPILAIINGTNRTLVSGYYPAGTIIEIPTYEYLNPHARLEIFSLPQKLIVNASLLVNIKAISQFLVFINLPNGSISGWYNNGSVIIIPKVIKVNGTTYILNGSDEIKITHPLFVTPEYIVTHSSSLTVQVYNVLGRPATTVPGVVLGVLYNSSFKEVAYMNSSGYLYFYGVSPGTYTLEVYHYPNTGLNLTEYWGGMTVNLQPGSNFVTFYRHEPWIYNLQASASSGEIVVNVTVNGTVSSPTQGEIELWVTNNPSLASPRSPSEVFNVTINPGLNKFNLTCPVNQAGTYYVYTAVLTHISTYTVTDQWNWTATTVLSSSSTTNTQSLISLIIQIILNNKPLLITLIISAIIAVIIALVVAAKGLEALKNCLKFFFNNVKY